MLQIFKKNATILFQYLLADASFQHRGIKNKIGVIQIEQIILGGKIEEKQTQG